MTTSLSARPSTYVGPRSKIEIVACKLLLKVMIRSPRIRIVFNRDLDDDDDEFDFVLFPPRLWTTIKILASPNLWVGESFITGAWYLSKGDLSDFLDAIRKDAPGRFERYYQFTASLRGLRYYLG